jgi:lipoyl(octanoyl) transferase
MTRVAWLIRPEGPVPYGPANAAMHELAERRLSGEVPDTVVLLEHHPVFTAGRRSKLGDLRWSRDEVAARGGEIHRIDRGGAFTFHGPGQVVGYPILDLGVRPDAGAYLRALEEVVIRAAGDVGVALERREDVQTGVWSGNQKVCAIGIRLMRARVTLHGFALNCDPDLSWYDGIVACGLPNHGVTSLSALAGRQITAGETRPIIERHLAGVFDVAFAPASPEVGGLFSPTAMAS